MNMISVKCPHCGADLKINDEIDMFYCNFCGGKIFMDGLSDAAYESRTKIKGMKHEEVMLDKKYKHEKYMKEIEYKKDKKVKIFIYSLLFLLFLVFLLTQLI